MTRTTAPASSPSPATDRGASRLTSLASGLPWWVVPALCVLVTMIGWRD